MKVGEELLISKKGIGINLCKSGKTQADRVYLKVLEGMEQRELPVKITLLQGIPELTA